MENNNQTPKIFYYLGGRKMALALIAMLVGGLVEVYSATGMSASFAGLLAALVTAFSAANTMITNKQVDHEPTATDSTTPELDEVKGRLESLEKGYQADMQVVAQTMETLNNAVQESNKRVNTLLTTRKV